MDVAVTLPKDQAIIFGHADFKLAEIDKQCFNSFAFSLIGVGIGISIGYGCQKSRCNARRMAPAKAPAISQIKRYLSAGKTPEEVPSRAWNLAILFRTLTARQ